MKAKIKPRIDLENRTKLETVIPLNAPFIVDIDPSDVCNFRCKFCPTADRKLIKTISGRNSILDFNLYKKIVNDICEFEKPIKVLRLFKDGEPLVNPRFAEMIKYARDKKCTEKIDTTTNASLLTPEKSLAIIEAGIDRINISIEGVNNKQYFEFSKYKIDFDDLVENIAYLYKNRKNCEIIVKICGDTISAEDKDKFYKTFGDIADGVYVEHVMSAWPNFELKEVKVNQEVGVYGQKIKQVEVCPYLFYHLVINADGSVSACCFDWAHRLLIGDVKKESLKDIWNGKKLFDLQKMSLKRQRRKNPVCNNCGQLSHGYADDIDAYAGELLKKLIAKNVKEKI